jgi:CRISPR-associated protein Cas1
MLSLPDFKNKNIIICFALEGQKVAFRNDNIIIADSESNVLMQATCHRIFSLWIVGHSTITTVLMEKSRKHGFSIFLLSPGFRPNGVLNNTTEGNFLLRRKQYAYTGTGIAAHLVGNKIRNQQALLKTVRRKSLSLRNSIPLLDDYIANCVKASDYRSIMGIEGAASRIFFSEWFHELPWKGRKPRTKIDMINAVLDIGYTYLFNLIDCMLNLYGFDIYQGVYHKNFYMRKSLVCDLVEPFRCIVDRLVKKAFNLKQINHEHFNIVDGRFLLSIEHNKIYAKWIMNGILEYKLDIFNYIQTYYRSFMRDKAPVEYPEFLINE